MERHQCAFLDKSDLVSNPVLTIQYNTSFSPVAIQMLERISHLKGDAYRDEEGIMKDVAGVFYAGV